MKTGKRSPLVARSYTRFNRKLACNYERWMIAMHYAATTKRIYRKVVRDFVEFLGDKSAAAVDHEDIRLFIARISEDGTSLGAVHRALGVLRMFYDFLNLGGVVSYVAPRFVKLRRPWWNRRAPLSESQVRQLIDASRTLRERAFIEFLYGSGARLSEATHLRIEHVDFRAKAARVDGKFGKSRIVLLPDSAVEALRHYIGNRQNGFVFQQDYPAQKGVFHVRNGSWESIWYHYDGAKRIRRTKTLGRITQMPYENAWHLHQRLLARHNLVRPVPNRPVSQIALQTLIRNVAKRAGLGNVTPHILRRTFATHLYDHGASVEIIKALMGHVWMQTTMSYVSMGPDRLAQTFQRCHPRHSDSYSLIAKRVLFQPWFLPKRVAVAIHAIVPPDFWNKMRHFFDDYGCMICGADSEYASNGMCKKCYDDIRRRMALSVKRRLKPERLRRLDFEVIRQEKLARKLLGKFAGPRLHSRRRRANGVIGKTNPVYALMGARFDE